VNFRIIRINCYSNSRANKAPPVAPRRMNLCISIQNHLQEDHLRLGRFLAIVARPMFVLQCCKSQNWKKLQNDTQNRIKVTHAPYLSDHTSRRVNDISIAPNGMKQKRLNPSGWKRFPLCLNARGPDKQSTVVSPCSKPSLRRWSRCPAGRSALAQGSRSEYLGPTNGVAGGPPSSAGLVASPPSDESTGRQPNGFMIVAVFSSRARNRMSGADAFRQVLHMKTA